MAIHIEQDSTDELIALAEFIEHFNVHYTLLLRRYERFKEIDDISNRDIDVITYLDMIIVARCGEWSFSAIGDVPETGTISLVKQWAN